MIDSVSAANVSNAERFTRLGIAADGQAASRVREEFGHWLDAHFALDPVRSSDLILATNEALANAAEFAYANTGRSGTMDVQADFDAAAGVLTVTIADQGTWRDRSNLPPSKARGRGIPLMEALTDSTSIDRTPTGTRVLLQWTGVASRTAPSETATVE
ncbi:ATP-binding protein [Mycolicibacterium litorale]|uniref:Anti-sigma regulatory factor n=1 Tax=Mycolicibacterium litorale TaxID=758802 RepID=A0AAD1IIS3_9MYCO|nr:ATP-binding protein [Mycolicibacterium litorale]MCV7414856.1 ATP-binding protein [Mycolicibacterium litorale]TDY08103.1 anti-sigma regulatory factor (Ser/Thr protein kinase) [Mycolicibacterium litorale]BBY16024.1 anti-sigma regulatory factor [Mycolicibacterium litorale]